MAKDLDSADLEHLGYTQELFRGMGGFSNFAVSFSVISILTGATQLYGYGLQHGGPLQLTVGWAVVSFFTLMVALAMAELASSYPTSGALYHWSSFIGGKKLGWFTACFNTIGQFAILAGVDYGLAQFVSPILNSKVLSVNLIYAVVLFSHALLNHIGIKVVAWLNDFSAWYHIGVVCLLLGCLAIKGFAQPPSFLFKFSSTGNFSPTYNFLIGLLLAQWTLTGYDASAHVTEETLNPRHNAPWGIIIAVVVSAVVGLVMLGAVTLSISDLNQALAWGDSSFYEILKLRLGEKTGITLLLLISGAMWLCGLATMTSASRMVYAFARDGGLPYSKLWSYVSKSHQSPTFAIWGLALTSLILALSVNVYSAVVSIATIALYVSYGLPLVARIVARIRKTPDEIGPWNLGRHSQKIAIVGVLWIIFITVIFVIPPNEKAGLVMVIFIIALQLLWHFWVRHHFSGPLYHPVPSKKS